MLDFLFVYEHAQRELESIVLLGAKLKQLGYSVEYIQIPVSEAELPAKYFNNVRCVFAPCLYSDHELYICVYRIAGKAHYVVNLQWEQLLTKERDEDMASFWFPKEHAKSAFHICWGEHTKYNLIRAGVPEQNALVTGAVQLDVLSREFDSYYMTKNDLFEKFKINMTDKTILFISSFSAVNLDEYTYNHMCEVLGKDTYDEFVEISTKSQEKIVEWLLKLCSAGYTVIYRPHPNEALSKLVEDAKANDNFLVIGEYSAKQWVRCVDYVYTWISTTYVECTKLNIPCGVLRPYELAPNKDMCIFGGVEFIDSYEALLQTLKSPAHDNRERISRYVLVDEKPAYQKVIESVLELINQKKRFAWPEELTKPMDIKKKAENGSRRRIRLLFFIHKCLKAVGLNKLPVFRRINAKYDNNVKILENYRKKRFDPLSDVIGEIEQKYIDIIHSS